MAANATRSAQILPQTAAQVGHSGGTTAVDVRLVGAKGDESESWRQVVGFEGLYEISDMGRVRSGRTGLLLSPYLHNRKYLRVDLRRRGEPRRRAFVHALVLEAFVGPCPPGHEGRHVYDPTPSNCCLWNLAWGTKKENGQDRVRHGTSGMADLAGRTFGSLTVIGPSAATTKNKRWHCRCSCGGEHEVRGDLLVNGKVGGCRSCRGRSAA